MKLDHIALRSKDIKKSIDWYVATFKDVEILYHDATWALINVCGTPISFVSPHQHPPHISFCVDDDYINDNLRDKVFKKHRDGTSSCYVKDPDGNFVEFLKRKDQ